MKIVSIFISAFTICVLSACNKTDFNYPADTVGSSKIIYFPSVTIKGDRLIIIDQGATFTDPGADALLNGAPVEFTTTGAVDVNTPGIYDLTYSASNSQGYSSSDWRTVVVIAGNVSANDFSGTYLRAATGVTSTWTKTDDGIYTVENPGGAGVGAGQTVLAVNYTGTRIAIPHQISPDFGEVSSSDETYSEAPPATYSWVFHAGGYGTGLRTFVKQ